MTVPAFAGAAARRLAAIVAVLLGAATLAFGALELIPSDPVAILLGPATAPDTAVRHQIAAQYGLAQPVAVRYARFLARLPHGDLGRSYRLQRPVASLIAEQLGPTAQLAGAAVVAVSSVSRQRDDKGRSSYSGLGPASFRGSAELEFGADSAYLLDASDGTAVLRCVKARYARPADVYLRFDGAYQRFDPGDPLDRFDAAPGRPREGRRR